MENEDLSPVTPSGLDVGQSDSPRGNRELLREKREMDVGTQRQQPFPAENKAPGAAFPGAPAFGRMSGGSQPGVCQVHVPSVRGRKGQRRAFGE